MIQLYALIFTLGVLIAISWTALRAPAAKATARIDAGLASLAGGLIGARLAYVVTQPGIFSDQIWKVLWFWQGGLSWAGGALGAIVGLAIYTRLAHGSFWDLADALAAPTVLVAAAAWAGCLADGCAYGRRAEAGLLTPASADALGFSAPRWPTQVIGMLLSLGALALLVWLARKRPPEGAIGSAALCLVAGSALGLSFVRGDPVPVWEGLRLEAIGAAVILVGGLVAVGLRLRRGRPLAGRRPDL